MPRRKRRAEAFNMSFLDCMCCGFGAVVLLFMIISATMTKRQDELNKALSERAEQMRNESIDGELNLAEIRNTLDEESEELVTARGRAKRIIDLIRQRTEEIADRENQTLAERESINKLMADIRSLEEDVKRLSARAAEPDDLGNRLRAFEGQGNRQYLTGVKVGGERVLVLLDTSTSMLDRTVVNVIRRRNMSDDQKRRAPKWQRALATVDWISTQIPPESQFQMMTFNDETKPVLADSDGEWMKADEAKALDDTIAAVRELVPSGGTNLHAAFTAVAAMEPPPDIVYLVVDSLPTRGENAPLRRTVTGKQRMRHFDRAVRVLPKKIPINVIMFPMEGDAEASAAYWRLAFESRGSFMSPAEDWP